MNTRLQPRAPAGDTSADLTGRTLVAGVGNMFLRDDGFGPEVARRLAAAAAGQWPGVQVVDYGIRGMHLAYDLLAGVDALVLVDTVPPDPHDAEPGSIRVLHVGAEDLAEAGPLDPHGMDPAAVLNRLRSLGGKLPPTYVVGCVPADTTEGIGLSPAVAAAVPKAMAAVVTLLEGNVSHPT
ncbi:hydrogenase maturation protease [Arthrobacter sulfonylureivorans]|uniref:Hydrogenase maturation protease n=1 Tax=Arthrobacter sulfonylureivorans TaxID=2486855 RepID=A0ABY3WF43_9MICC|nr:hydrogenase maturation protease [Arthrobacter sulfonylureivorans]UNK46952.1 hydrogenase maturation protease [Arthrobacter sulfonylureivorans]